VSQYQYHLFESPLGWIGLLGTGNGLRRLSLKPTPQEALEELGPALDRATSDLAAFTREQSCLDRYFQGDVAALYEIRLDLEAAPPFSAPPGKPAGAYPPERPAATPGWPPRRDDL
jgi:hypothetical protein